MFNSKKSSIIYKIIICIISFVSICLNIGLFTNNLNLKSLTMFTLISNILCFIYFLIDIICLYHNYKDKNKTYFKVFKGIVTICITVTNLVAFFILKMYISFDSITNISFIGLHYVVPFMTILDYFLFDEKGNIKYYYPFIWLIIPFIYTILSFIAAFVGHGFGIDKSSRYPYPYMDLDKLGYTKVGINIISLLILFIVLGYIFVFVDKRLEKEKRK